VTNKNKKQNKKTKKKQQIVKQRHALVGVIDIDKQDYARVSQNFD